MDIRAPFQVVILGYSDIVRRKILPAIESTPEMTVVGIAGSQLDAAEAERLGCALGIPTTHGKSAVDAMLARTDPPGVAYVSGVNAQHAQRVAAALDHGFDVIVDKPAWLSSRDTREIDEAARSRGLSVNEAMVWNHSSLAQWWLAQVDGWGQCERVSRMRFTIPSLDRGNYRVGTGPGSGPLWDLAPYFISQLQEIATARAQAHLDVRARDLRIEEARRMANGAIKIAASGPGVRAEGVIGFDLPYANSLEVISPIGRASVAPAFTEPASLQQEATAFHEGFTMTRRATSRDSFTNFFADLAEQLQHRQTTGVEMRVSERIHLLEEIHEALGS